MIHRTAGYGPVCPVVWEGRRRETPPYPDLHTMSVVCGLQEIWGLLLLVGVITDCDEILPSGEYYGTPEFG
jgi:hypothetical protein